MLSNVYVFTGNPFLVHSLRREWARRFREKYGMEGISSFDLAESGESDRLLQELTLQSFFVSKRLLVVQGNPFSTVAKRGRKKKTPEAEGTVSPVLEALESADEEAIIVFTEEGGGSDWPPSIPTANIRRLSAANGRVVGYDPKRPLSYDGFFSAVFGDAISRDSLAAITRAIAEATRKDEEADLFAAYHALEQIAVLPKQEQTRTVAATFLDVSAEERGYDLVSTLLSARAPQALEMVKGMLRQGMHARQVFRMVATQVLDLLKAKTLIIDYPSLSEAGLANAMGKSSWQAGKIASTARRTDGGRLATLHEGLITMNVAMNSGDLDAEREEDFLAAFALLIPRLDAATGSAGSWNKKPATPARRPVLSSTPPAFVSRPRAET